MFDLKPCPFCGGKVKINYFYGNAIRINELHLKCKGCNCEFNLDGGGGNSFCFDDYGNEIEVATDVVTVWNTRN